MRTQNSPFFIKYRMSLSTAAKHSVSLITRLAALLMDGRTEPHRPPAAGQRQLYVAAPYSKLQVVSRKVGQQWNGTDTRAAPSNKFKTRSIHTAFFLSNFFVIFIKLKSWITQNLSTKSYSSAASYT